MRPKVRRGRETEATETVMHDVHRARTEQPVAMGDSG